MLFIGGLIGFRLQAFSWREGDLDLVAIFYAFKFGIINYLEPQGKGVVLFYFNKNMLL